MVKRHVKNGKCKGARKFNGPKYKGTVKKVINNLPKYSTMSIDEKPKKKKGANKPQGMDISEPKAPKLSKAQKREKRKQAVSLGKVGKTSPKAMP
ncbi:kif2, partial [Symbiodinium pilosum]